MTAAILAAAMSNLSAALNSMASTTIMDFVKPLSRSQRSESHYLKLARYATVLWGAVLFIVGLFAQYYSHSVLEAGLTIASVLYGGLLGVFLLGLLTTGPGETAAIVGMCAGLVATFALQPYVAYTWYILVGTSVTFVTGLAVGLFTSKSARAQSVRLKGVLCAEKSLLQKPNGRPVSPPQANRRSNAFSGLERRFYRYRHRDWQRIFPGARGA